MLGRGARRLLLGVHLAASVGWVGGVVAYLALAVAVPVTEEPATVRAAWIGMELVGWWALAPLAVTAWLTGVLLALATRWGLFRHWWVLVSLAATTVLAGVLLLHLPEVSAGADHARAASDQELRAMGSDIPHAAIGLVLLLAVMALNIAKPAGLTRHGWRRQQAARPTTSA